MMMKTNENPEENIYSIFVGAKSVGDLATISEAYGKILRSYLLSLRKSFQENNEVRGAILEENKENRRERVLELVKSLCINAETEDIFEKAVDMLLEEYDKMKLAPHQQYLVDEQTGMVIAPLGENSTYTPPDYIGEDGQKHKSLTIVHPGISSALGLALQERYKTKKAIDEGGIAYEHLKDPSSITIAAREFIELSGYKVTSCSESIIVTYEIGREQEDVFQSPNKSFHRHRLFGAILARKIINDMRSNNSLECELSQPKLMRGGKQRWYSVDVKIQTVKTLDPHVS